MAPEPVPPESESGVDMCCFQNLMMGFVELEGSRIFVRRVIACFLDIKKGPVSGAFSVNVFHWYFYFATTATFRWVECWRNKLTSNIAIIPAKTAIISI